MSAPGIVIVGAGQAGFQAAASLREAGFSDPVTLVGDEPGLPYQRPPLSKAYLAGKVEAAGLALRPERFLAEHRIVLRAGARAVRIDRTGRLLHLRDGASLRYDHLVLATGSRNRALPVPGAGLAGVHQLRSLADAGRLRAALGTAHRIAIVGAGFIGLEFASVCAARGLDVTVIEAADRAMARAVSAEAASFFRGLHEEAGVRFAFRAAVAEILGQGGEATGVRLGDGREVVADLVLVGIGVVANDELAAEAGLAVGDGIHVDAQLATGDPAISALGDCARFPSRFADGIPGAGIRIESVQNAIEQGRCLAGRLAGGASGLSAPYDAVPWFWSDQGGRKLQIAGLSAPGDSAVARASGTGFSVFRYRGQRLSAVESVDRGADHMAARRILSRALTLTPDQAADPAFDLKALAARDA